MGLHDEGVTALEPGATGAPVMEVEIVRIEGRGRTDVGTEFVAVRYDAVLRLHRTDVTVRGAPFTAADGPRRDDAREELVARIVPIVAY